MTITIHIGRRELRYLPAFAATAAMIAFLNFWPSRFAGLLVILIYLATGVLLAAADYAGGILRRRRRRRARRAQPSKQRHRARRPIRPHTQGAAV